MRRARFIRPAPGVLLALTVALAAPADPENVLTLADVVRLHVAKTPAEVIVRRIREAEAVRFDVSPEMMDELRAAGVPDVVLSAIADRAAYEQRKRRALSASEGIEPVPGETSRLVVIVNADDPAPKHRHVRVFDQAAPWRDRPWQVGDDRFLDVAVFVICTRADHVPDRWTMHTPIVNPSREAPRHRLLAFRRGASWSPAGLLRQLGLAGSPDADDEGEGGGTVPPSERDRLGLLDLELPERLECEAARGTAHDLAFGLALETVNGFTVWALAEIPDVVIEGDRLELSAVARNKGKLLAGVEVALRRP